MAFKKIAEKLKQLKINNRLIILSVVSIVAVIMIAASEIKSTEKNDIPAEEETQAEEFDYAKDIEDRLTDLLSSIEGAGKTRVMVTLESSAEKIYASDLRENTEDSSSEDGDRDSRNEKTGTYVIIDTDTKGQGGLILKIVQPKVRGVAVVCEGADSASVRKNITDTVAAVLDIDNSNIHVTKGA